MFDETKASIERASSAFTDHVRDSFGQSIKETAFDGLLRAVNGMKVADDAAKLREAEIHALTLELRAII